VKVVNSVDSKVATTLVKYILSSLN
jgi:hypothetical protein